MVKKSHLKDVLSDEKFERIESEFRKQFGFGLETSEIDGRRVKKMCSGDCYPEFCKVVRGSTTGL
ncbi:MAG: hypothetical protein ACYSXD_08345, partial [Planctomycetota bacterium]